jgi:hypothetical protein
MTSNRKLKLTQAQNTFIEALMTRTVTYAEQSPFAIPLDPGGSLLNVEGNRHAHWCVTNQVPGAASLELIQYI